jgi:choline dehydrogenase
VTVAGDKIRSVEVPARIVHDPGSISRIGELAGELGIERPLLVTDSGVVGAGLATGALRQLENAVVFDRVRPNPDIELVGEGSAAYREHACDGLVAIGGGSPIDTAKAIGVEVEHGGSILEYEYGGTPIRTGRTWRHERIWRTPRSTSARTGH